MNMSNGSLDCLPYLDAAQSITQQIEDIPFISVNSAFLSGAVAERKSQSKELCKTAMVDHLQLHGIHLESDCDITIEKSIWGQPLICLSENVKRQVKEKRIERLLVSTTNDCDILLCIAAAVQSNKFSNEKPLGFGVDLMYHQTSDGLFRDCSSEVLSEVFSEREMNCAFQQADVFYYSKLVSIKEAVFKSISEAFHYSGIDSFSNADIQMASFMEIEVLDMSGEWVITRLHGQLAEISQVSGVKRIVTQFVSGKNYIGAIAVSMGKSIA